jgi:RHS repeat-associated protein
MSSHRWNQTVTQGSGPSPSYAFSNGTISNTNHIISGVSYDDAGNMTYDGSYYYTYDGNNRVIGIGTSSGSNNVASYSYNSRGMRVSVTSGGASVEWLFDLAGNALTQSIPGTLQFYQAEYFVGGRDWGTLATGGVNFRYPDWVGNGRVWQDVAGTVTQQAAYAAFGDGLFAPGGGSCCSLQAGMFDDAWQDSANNTYHTLNREYSPTQGRWLTPDPAGLAAMDVTNPQTWNRYAYVTNNPVSFTDPLGLFVQACFSAPGGGGCDLTGGGGGGGDDGSGPPCYMCGGPGGGGGGYGGEPGSGGPSGPTFAAPVFGGGFGAGCGSDFLPCGATPPGLAEILGLPTWDDVLNPIMDAANNGQEPPPACQAQILNATNNQFGTNYTNSNVTNTFNYSTGAGPGQGTLNLNISGSTAGVSTGYYPVNWWTYIIGYGPTLHVVSGPGGNGGLDSQQTLPFGPNQGTFHIDSGYPINPIGAAFHWLLNMTKAGGYPKC